MSENEDDTVDSLRRELHQARRRMAVMWTDEQMREQSRRVEMAEKNASEWARDIVRLRRGVAFALSAALTRSDVDLRTLVMDVVIRVRDGKSLLDDERCEKRDSNGVRCEVIGPHERHDASRQLKTWLERGHERVRAVFLRLGR